MKCIAFSILLASVAIGAPAMASDFKEGHRMHSYYSSVERDQVNQGVVTVNRADVKNIQRALKEAGYKTGPVDGIIGPKTRAALKKFQKDRNLIANGKTTPITLGALRVATRVDFSHKLNRNYN